MTTMNQLMKDTNAPSVAALEAQIDALGLTVEFASNDQDTIDILSEHFAPAKGGGLAKAAPAGAAVKKGRKTTVLKTSAVASAKKANESSALQLSSVTAATRLAGAGRIEDAARRIVEDADVSSDMLTELLLAYPAMVDAMVVQKVLAGQAEMGETNEDDLWDNSELTGRLETMQTNWYAKAGIVR